MATAKELLEGSIQTQTLLKAYFWNDTTSSYDDFSDRFSQDRLVNTVRVIEQAEGKYEQPVTKSVTLLARNDDRYWDQDTPTDYDPWEGRYVQIRLNVAGASDNDVTLATFRIAPNGITTTDGPIASIVLEPLTEALSRTSADEVKRGTQKYENRPYTYLVQEIIRSEYGDSSGDLPSGYVFPSDPRFTYPDAEKHYSPIGKPPQWDGTSWNDDNTDISTAVALDNTNGIIYVGIYSNLWAYTVATDTWEDLGNGSYGTSTTIRAIFVTTAAVVVCKWDEDPAGANYIDTLYIALWKTSTETWDVTSQISYGTFFPGQWWIYNGTSDGGVRARGHYDGVHPGTSPNDYGVNVPVPFRQWTRSGSVGTVQQSSSAGLRNDVGYSGSAHSNLPRKGIRIHASYVDKGGINNLLVRLNYGNKPNVAFDRVDGVVDGYLYIVRVSGGTAWEVYKVSLKAGSATTATKLTTDSLNQLHGLTLDMSNTYVSFIEFTESSSGAADTTDVRYISTTTPGGSTSLWTNASLEDADDFIVDILLTQVNGQRVIGIKEHRVNFDTFPEWKVFFKETAGETIYDNSMSYFQAFDRNLRTAFPTFPVLYLDSSTGTIKRITGWYNTPELVDGGLSPVPESPFAADIYVEATGTDPDMVGLTYPFHDPDTQEIQPEGKYYLWQYDAKHTGRVELGDFDGLSKLEAAQQLCSAFSHVVRVAPDGDFVVEPRNPTGTPSETISKVGFTWGWSSIRRLKSADIQNYFREQPYEAIVQPMETTVHLTADSEFNGQVIATQHDTKSRRVKLRCIREGKIDTAGSNQGNAWFDFRTFYDDVVTRLATAYSGGTSVTVESTEEIEVGDSIRVLDSEIRDVTAVNTGTKVITINSAFTGAYNVLSETYITKANDNKWSSHGITEVDSAVSATDTDIVVKNASNISVGNLITFLDNSAEAREVSSIDYDTDTVTVTSGVTSAHSVGCDIGVIVKPTAQDESYMIGGQNISVLFTSYSTGAEDIDVAEGDHIDFNCPGMSLRKVRNSYVRVSDNTSIKEHGKRKAKSGRANRFLTFRLMEYKFDQLVSRYKDRKRRYQVKCPLTTGRELYDTFYLESEDFFPDESNNKLAVIIHEVHIDVSRHEVVYVVEEQ
jgi:hypothetical protein